MEKLPISRKTTKKEPSSRIDNVSNYDVENINRKD